MNNENEIIKLKQLYEILPFGEKKIRKLIASGEIPVVKIGRDYITTKKLVTTWIEEHVGEELFL